MSLVGVLSSEKASKFKESNSSERENKGQKKIENKLKKAVYEKEISYRVLYFCVEYHTLALDFCVLTFIFYTY